ncbi:hypothetical protein AMC90_CH03104 [Rhizobium phaseoli]|uniref:Lipoprotein n=1 Tax=Rhizobium etli (strain CIAT 652) TaxID=491916 RepID=B3PUG7_RHIE6|nr:hypothetical protein [Rhizobium phaseoli]ACE92048.1 hypothetical protein RHECIAT_CH0003100 [Rhizobium etli CIAT 652]ANL28894.1 hypothetical protein AMC90_CH03104 [Rhizobium phaseoli]PCD67930.1 hypothetical protein CO648_08630 [Rhizobium phaseoli]
MRLITILSIALAIGLAGCTQVAEKAENAANRSFTSYALGKPYTDIANLGQSPMAQLSGSDATYGPMIGATPLKNGMTVYRHMAAAAKTETAGDCVHYIGGIINRCNDMRQLQASLALYDARVATKGGQPISSWGEAAAPVVN